MEGEAEGFTVSPWQRAQHRGISADDFPLPHPAQDSVNKASQPPIGMGGVRSKLEVGAGSEDPMGPEPDGKLGSYSEICIMGHQRNQRVLALTVLGTL